MGVQGMSTKLRTITIEVVAQIHHAEWEKPGFEYLALSQGQEGYGASEEAAIRDLTARIAETTAYRLAHAE